MRLLIALLISATEFVFSEEINLSVTSDNYRINYQIEDLGSGAMSVQLNGVMVADITVNEDGSVTDFIFSGGTLSYSDGTAAIDFPLSVTSTLATEDVSATPRSTGALPTIDESGILNPAAHELNFDEGSNKITTVQDIFGSESIIAFEQRFFENDPLPVSWTRKTQVTAEWEEISSLFRILKVTLNHTPTQGRDTVIIIPPINPTMTIIESGTYTAIGEKLVPDEGYRIWAMEAGFQPKGMTDEVPGGRIPAVIAYALGLTPQGQPNFQNDGSGMILALPEDGTRAEVIVEASPSLAEEDWIDVQTIPARTFGVLALAESDSNLRFFRLRVE